MTPRDMYLDTVLYRNPPRVPFTPGWGRRSTLAAWRLQGLPEEVCDPYAYVREILGLPVEQARPVPYHGVDFRMIPWFEEKVIERRQGTLVVQDWKGNVCEIADCYTFEHLRNAIDFVTRTWIRCPVEDRGDWERMKERYDVDDPRRFPADFSERCLAIEARDTAVGIGISGPWWQLREWLGFERLCELTIEDPLWVEEMIGFWCDFVDALLQKTFQGFVPDFVTINEDMAYKEHAMIGPEMVRRFLMPCWKRWSERCYGAGVKVFEVDSDGYVGQLIPLWIEAGFNMNSPQEVAAGNDLPVYSRAYGARMAYAGGVDKRAMAAGGSVIRREIDRLRPALEAGGYIPSCDHGVPPDVGWTDFVDYCRLLAHATGWL